jgi:hypothetical protein
MDRDILDRVKEYLEEAGVNWVIEKSLLYYRPSPANLAVYKSFPEVFAISKVDKDSGEVLETWGYRGKVYTPIQNEEFIQNVLIYNNNDWDKLERGFKIWDRGRYLVYLEIEEDNERDIVEVGGDRYVLRGCLINGHGNNDAFHHLQILVNIDTGQQWVVEISKMTFRRTRRFNREDIDNMLNRARVNLKEYIETLTEMDNIEITIEKVISFIIQELGKVYLTSGGVVDLDLNKQTKEVCELIVSLTPFFREDKTEVSLYRLWKGIVKFYSGYRVNNNPDKSLLLETGYGFKRLNKLWKGLVEIRENAKLEQESLLELTEGGLF